MKDLRVTATPDRDLVPEAYEIVSQSGAVTELRVIDWNLATEDIGTLLYAIEGDAEAFREAARETPSVESIEVSNGDAPTSYALVEARPSAMPFFEIMVTVVARAGMILRKPLVYRHDASHGHVVGKAEPLQWMFDEVAGHLDVEVEAIEEFPSATQDRSSRLTDRQREVLETALAMGYYEQPRETTHGDIADELGCGTSTVTDHLQKAEDTLVRSALADDVQNRW